MLHVLTTLWLLQIFQGYAINPLLLYSTKNDIRLANLSKIGDNGMVMTESLWSFSSYADVDYFYEEQKICWIDRENGCVSCANFTDRKPEKKIEIASKGDPSYFSLACDWLTKKVYWIDGERKRIKVGTLDGTLQKVLYWTNVQLLKAIALDPTKGLMFWTDCGDNPKIERAGMNGDPTTRKVLVSDNIHWPTGLTLDFNSELVYWVDYYLPFVEVMTYDGHNRSTIYKGERERPFSLTIFQTRLFWSDWRTKSIKAYDKNTKELKTVVDNFETNPLFVRIFDKERQPEQPHPCKFDNGNCSHLCLLSPDPPGYSCACPAGIKLINETTCADGPQNLLLLTRKSDIGVIYLDTPDHTYKELPLKNIKDVVALTYNPSDGFIYWSDNRLKTIQRSRLDGSEQEEVINGEFEYIEDMEVDWISQNIYWTDPVRRHVKVCGLVKPYCKVIASENLVNVRAIAVASELGWIFWSDWFDQNPKIERANLDGTERKKIISENLGAPYGLVLDLVQMKLYWCDAKTHRIEYSSMDGTNRSVLINYNLPRPFGFALIDDFLYWTDWITRSVNRAHKETGRQMEKIFDAETKVSRLKVLNPDYIPEITEDNLCAIDNGNCSQFCFYRHNRTSVCSCKDEYELLEDGSTCALPQTLLLYSNENQIGVVAIEDKNNDTEVISSDSYRISSVDYNTKNGRIYWSDTMSKSIMSSFCNGSDVQKIVQLGLQYPESIAVDWLSQNIYWTDTLANRIEVATLDGSSRRTLLWEDIHFPSSIALDPSNGYMYWSERRVPYSIKKAAMDGSNPYKIISNAEVATALALDFENKKIYWVENKLPEILCADLDGRNKKSIVKNDIFGPIGGLTIHKDFIYWSEDSSGGVTRANRKNGADRFQVYNSSDKVTDLLVFHPRCVYNNCGCSHLCLPVPTDVPKKPIKYSCTCPDHYILVDNECVPPGEFMIYGQKTLAVRLMPNPIDYPEAVLPFEGLQAVKAIDFDPIQNYLYWIEGKTQSIQKNTFYRNEFATVVNPNQNFEPFDLAVDSIGRLLFWTAVGNNFINVTRLDDGKFLGILPHNETEKPRILAIDPVKRLLFYTDVSHARRLVKIRLDGSQSVILARNADISAIAVDSENDSVFWAQGSAIFFSTTDGRSQRILINESGHLVMQLTVFSGWLYWITHDSFQLHGVKLSSGKLSTPLTLQASSRIVDLISVVKPDNNHPCLQRNCSHFCILDGLDPLCACPAGSILSEDRSTCVPFWGCGPRHFTCFAPPNDGNGCIPIAWKCDGEHDCFDGSDEMDCPICGRNQFRCDDGTCVNLFHVCDGIPHCQDLSDELQCASG